MVVAKQILSDYQTNFAKHLHIDITNSVGDGFRLALYSIGRLQDYGRFMKSPLLAKEIDEQSLQNYKSARYSDKLLFPREKYGNFKTLWFVYMTIRCLKVCFYNSFFSMYKLKRMVLNFLHRS